MSLRSWAISIPVWFWVQMCQLQYCLTYTSFAPPHSPNPILTPLVLISTHTVSDTNTDWTPFGQAASSNDTHHNAQTKQASIQTQCQQHEFDFLPHFVSVQLCSVLSVPKWDFEKGIEKPCQTHIRILRNINTIYTGVHLKTFSPKVWTIKFPLTKWHVAQKALCNAY